MTFKPFRYKKFNEWAQTANFSVLSRLRQELCAENPKKTGKQEKLKRELLKILIWYDLSRIGPCERARPQLSEYVWDMMVYMI